MGCDSPGPLTPEENRAVSAAIRRVEDEWNAKVEGYKDDIRKLINSGFRGSTSEIVAVIVDKHQPSKEAIREAASDIVLSQEYGMPDENWRISKPVL